jgi:adenylylsulfate kinase-like enzyme
MGTEVLVLHGSPGSGKTTLAEAIAERLRQANLPSALIDLDALSIVHPYQGRPFTRANLRAVWPNYAAVPDVRVVLPLVVVDHDDLRELKEMTRPARFLVCELSAPREVLERRVIDREPNDFWKARVLDFVALYHDRNDHPAIRDFQVRTDRGSVLDVASEVIGRCGWSAEATHTTSD